MSLKTNYINITKKHFGGPSSKEMIKKIGESVIRSIMRGSDIGASTAIKVATSIGVTVEELVTNKTKNKYHKTEKGNESRIYKSKEKGERMEGKLYDVEGLNQDKLDILQEMIDNWKGEEASKRKEERMKRAFKTKSQKNNTA